MTKQCAHPVHCHQAQREGTHQGHLLQRGRGPCHARQYSYMHFGLKDEVKVKAAQSCPTLCKPMDCSLPGSTVHGILQARILEWVAIPFSRVSSQPRDGTQDSHITGDSLPFEPPSTDGDQTMHIYYQRFYQRLSLKNSEIQ